MRPVPKARHGLAVAILVVVSALAHLHAACQQELADEQVGVLVNMLRSTNGQLYQRDAIFGDSGLWRFRTPVWEFYLREAYQAGGSASPAKALAMLSGPLTLIYLLGMYGLLYRQCRSWSIACYVAVLSTAVIPLAGDGWGLGPLSSLTADTVYLAFVPWLAWGLAAAINSANVLWVFLGAGLLANIHAVTAMNFALVAAAALLVHWRFARRGWLLAAGGVFCTVAGASPFLAYHLAQRMAFTADAPARWSGAAIALGPGGLDVLLPDVLAALLMFPTLGYVLALALPVAGAVLLPGRLAVKDVRLWLGMLVGAVVVGLGLHGLSQLAGMVMDRPPAVVDFIHALRFSLLALYVLLAEAIVQSARLGLPRRALRITLAAVLALWLVPSDNLAAGRQWVDRAATALMREEERSEPMRRRLTEPDRGRELEAIGMYLRHNTPIDTVVIGDQGRLRLWSQRALVVCADDVKYLYYLAPRRLEAWAAVLADQDEVLAPKSGAPIDRPRLERFALRYGAEFVVVPAAQATTAAPPQYWVESPDQSWGGYWKLYRVGGQAGE